VIVCAAFCPNPPVLVPAVAQGAAGDLDGLRAACIDVITRIAMPGRQLIVLGTGPAMRQFAASARGTFAGYGVPLEVSLGSDEPGPTELPLSLTVGAWLVREALGANCGAIGLSVTDGTDAGLADDGDVALLVMGDGSARRSAAAPGYLDDRAAGFDASVVAALTSGEGRRLAGINAADGAQLLAAGVPAWQAAGRLLGTRRYAVQVSYDDAPYGVGYFVAAWT
jgi:hypothetical protein